MTERTSVGPGRWSLAIDWSSRPFRLAFHPSSFVVLLTFLAGILRLMYLDRPCLWGDEAATFMRVCGTWQELKEELAIAGFAPLHYLLYWSIAQFTPLSPVVMRLPPAIAGTLMVPAMYFLAVQLVSRRTALLVASFTACSAYMLNYSRDAKMYAQAWLFVALSTACLLWAIRTRRRTAWYLWVIASLLMVGLHSVCLLVLPIQAVIFLANRRLHWLSGIYFVVGLAIILTPIWLYYRLFNQYHERIEQRGWRASGINWVEWYNQGYDWPGRFRYVATAFAYNWEWPRASDQPQIRERTRKLLKASGIALLGLAIMGIFPWRSFGATASASCTGGSDRIAATPWWLALFWILTWLLVPVVGFYKASEPQAAAPWEPFIALWRYLQSGPLLGLACAIPLLASMYFCGRSWRQRISKWLLSLAVAATVFALCVLAWKYVPTQPKSVWMPRYLGFIWPAFAIGLCVLLLRLPTRAIRRGAIGLLLLVNLAQHGARVFAGSEPPTELLVRDLLASQPPQSSTTRMYYGIRYRGRGDPGSGLLHSSPARYYIAILGGWKVTPTQIKDGLHSPPRSWVMSLGGMSIPPELYIPPNLSRSPQLRRIIVWDQLDPGQVDLNDRLLDRLSPQKWKRLSQQLYPVRDHWTWKDLLTARRRVYELKDPPQPQPQQ
ncbi:glycosyltransferase family 39 protein [Fontivita pretiosa]|uniref:glycosyltransferase family 39 protein n=1 Tax=Fontivita pretiosa TaxID=2989684 RepID=UPI003D16267F